MREFADQMFVWVKAWGVGWFPEAWQPWLSLLINIGAIIVVFALLFALTTVLERKILGRIQNRYGPNRVGPAGFLQFMADGIKALTKEDVVPRAADRVVHFLAPVVLLIPVLLSYSVLPVGRNMVAADLDAGVLFFFAVGAAVELSLFMAGWASRNKYSLFGAMRAIAQMISYEIPLILSAIPVLMLVGSLSTVAIVEAQGVREGQWLANWHVFTPWGMAGFALFFIASLSESNRSPFDLPEGESEIVAGYFVEYSGFKFALFFLGEYLGMFAITGLGITLFLGGWTAPVSFLDWIPSWAWFFGKLMSLIFVFIWIRGTVPRLRMDQLMGFAWKVMLPMALINIVVAGVWFYLPAGVLRWLFCAVLLLGPWLILGRRVQAARVGAHRQYRFAE